MTSERLSFTKMHGCGNDYIYVNTYIYKVSNPEDVSIRLSRPHFGVGSDGLILIGPPSEGVDADVRMRIFNADGSEALMCGNGVRCVGKYVYERGLCRSTRIRLQTESGIKVLSLRLNNADEVESVRVDMGKPSLDSPTLFDASHLREGSTPSLQQLEADGRAFTGTFVSMGNPHFVIFMDEDVEKFDIRHYGPLLERHAAFPQRCNVEFVQKTGEGAFRVRVWERGSGVTMACGTGACAVCVAANMTGRATQNVKVQMDGGELQVDWDKKGEGHAFLTGPAEFVFEGQVDIPQ